MARTITTVTTTAKGSLPYHFICNYCGCRNDKTAETAGIAVGGRENVGGALLDLQGEPERYRERIRAYAQRLRDGTALPAGKYDAAEYSASSLLILGLDGRCSRCGKVQAWAIDPSSQDSMLRTGCLGVLACVVLGLVLLLIGSAVANVTLGTVLMVLGGVVWVAGSLGSMIVYAVKKRRDTNRKLAELAAAPNDPDKLPVIDA